MIIISAKLQVCIFSLDQGTGHTKYVQKLPKIKKKNFYLDFLENTNYEKLTFLGEVFKQQLPIKIKIFTWEKTHITKN